MDEGYFFYDGWWSGRDRLELYRGVRNPNLYKIAGWGYGTDFCYTANADGSVLVDKHAIGTHEQYGTINVADRVTAFGSTKYGQSYYSDGVYHFSTIYCLDDGRYFTLGHDWDNDDMTQVEEVFVPDASTFTLTYMVDGTAYQTYQLHLYDDIPVPDAPTKDGYTFEGWDELPEFMPYWNVEINAHFTKNAVDDYVDVEEGYNILHSLWNGYQRTKLQQSKSDKTKYRIANWGDNASLCFTMQADGSVHVDENYMYDHEDYGAIYARERDDFFANNTHGHSYYADGIYYLATVYTLSDNRYFTYGLDWQQEDMTKVVEMFIPDSRKFKLTYMVDGEVYRTFDFSYRTPITPLDAPAKQGYDFSGWDEVPEFMPPYDVVVNGHFERTGESDDDVYRLLSARIEVIRAKNVMLLQKAEMGQMELQDAEQQFMKSAQAGADISQAYVALMECSASLTALRQEVSRLTMDIDREASALLSDKDSGTLAGKKEVHQSTIDALAKRIAELEVQIADFETQLAKVYNSVVGIATVSAEKADSEIYSLSGLRMKRAEKGVNIIGGVKKLQK